MDFNVGITDFHILWPFLGQPPAQRDMAQWGIYSAFVRTPWLDACRKLKSINRQSSSKSRIILYSIITKSKTSENNSSADAITDIINESETIYI